jgi:hypothetical protein
MSFAAARLAVSRLKSWRPSANHVVAGMTAVGAGTALAYATYVGHTFERTGFCRQAGCYSKTCDHPSNYTDVRALQKAGYFGGAFVGGGIAGGIGTKGIIVFSSAIVSNFKAVCSAIKIRHVGIVAAVGLTAAVGYQAGLLAKRWPDIQKEREAARQKAAAERTAWQAEEDKRLAVVNEARRIEQVAELQRKLDLLQREA